MSNKHGQQYYQKNKLQIFTRINFILPVQTDISDLSETRKLKDFETNYFH